MKRILIAGTNSGCGKTTVTLGILAALKARGLRVASCKCGPDYIDPMFHRAALGVSAWNLDPFFSTPTDLRRQAESLQGDAAIFEGVMGYYDGLGATSDCSTYSVAAATGTPVVLVINARGMSASAGAILRGFLDYRERSGIVGVIFNGVSPKMLPTLSRVAQDCGVKCLGCLPREDSVSLESRHLGLVTAQELPQLQEKLSRLGALAEENLDLDSLLELGADSQAPAPSPMPAPHVKLAVAADRAFCFTYQETLTLFARLGCEILPFSPLEDEALPQGAAGLYLPGGYPELYLEELAQNVPMRQAVRAAIAAGMPTIAECGGFLYLHHALAGQEMAGVLPGEGYATQRLQRFGYVTLTAQRDNVLCHAGEQLRGHEFHYWDSPSCGSDCIARKASTGREYPCVHATDTLWAGFPHLYLPANPGAAEHFVGKMEEFSCHTCF